MRTLPNGGYRCDCEQAVPGHENCGHEAGACQREGVHHVEIYGMKEWLCDVCCIRAIKFLGLSEVTFLSDARTHECQAREYIAQQAGQ